MAQRYGTIAVHAQPCAILWGGDMWEITVLSLNKNDAGTEKSQSSRASSNSGHCVYTIHYWTLKS